MGVMKIVFAGPEVLSVREWVEVVVVDGRLWLSAVFGRHVLQS
jgi:hypothetical protein